MSKRRLLLLPALLGLAAAAWWAWPDEAPAVAVQPPAASVALPPAAVELPASVAMPVLAAPPPGCVTATPPSAHERALALQRAVAQLASGSGADAVLALLMQRPAADETAALATWREQVRWAALRSQDAQALVWAAAACDSATCRRELLQGRIRVEPENALHWAALIDEDPAAADAAWQGLAAARYWREQPQAAATRVGRALPPGHAVPDLDWAAPAAPLSSLANVCGHYGPGHPVGLACAHATTLMLAHSDTSAAWQQGAELARQMGRSEVPPPPPLPAAPACR